MIDISFTFALYYTMLLLIPLLAWISNRYSGGARNTGILSIFTLPNAIGLLLIAFITGFRYNVGVDWAGYKLDYDSLLIFPETTYSDQYYEYGFYIYNKMMASFELEYVWMFFGASLISWYYIYRSVESAVLPFLLFFLFADEYFFWSMNGVRQFMAISLWVFSIKYIISRDLVRFTIVVFLASLFHTSVLFLLPFYFLPYQKMSNRIVWVGAFVVTYLVGNNNYFIGLVEQLFGLVRLYTDTFSTYDRYIDTSRIAFNYGADIGLGYLFKVLLNLSIILTSYLVIEKKPSLKPYFVFTFIGICLYNMTYSVHLLDRFNNYFIIFRSFALAYLCYYLWPVHKYRIAILTIMVLYIVLYGFAINNSSNMSSPYYFRIP